MQLIDDRLLNGDRMAQQSSLGSLDNAAIYESAGIQNHQRGVHILRREYYVGHHRVEFVPASKTDNRRKVCYSNENAQSGNVDHLRIAPFE